MTVDAIRSMLDELFAPVVRYTRTLPAQRDSRDLEATFTLPVDLASAGFACRVERHGDGYMMTITRAATGAVPKLTAIGEAVFDAHRRLDRMERDLDRQRERDERARLAA